MKRTVIFILSACMLLICGISAFAIDSAEALSKNEAAGKDETASKSKVKLSSLSDEECWEFIIDNGVTIPEEFSDRDFDLRKFFEWLEEDPDRNLGVNYGLDFYEAIREALKSYYGIASDSDAAKTLRYTLQDSTLEG